jgi:transposase InsO family protein
VADILGPLTASEKNNTYILVIGDYLSRYVETIPMPNQTAETVLHAVIDQFILRYGKMEQIHTDQGTQFQSATFRNFC